MQTKEDLVLAAGTHTFRYRSPMRGGDLHVFENMDTGAQSVITNTTYKLAKPFLQKTGHFYVYPKDKLPAAVCTGLSIPTVKE